jgi:membrane protein DedA with SNARE-associated domain
LLIDVPANLGYPLLFALVGAESAGLLVPGETALIFAAALSSQGRLSLPAVIAIAAGAAILGDNIGYLLGRRGLRLLVDRPGRSSARRRQLLARSESFFERHGATAVFFGRWLPGLRVFAAWLAGANRMHWSRFLFWNALGGIGWACTIGVLAFLVGRSVENWAWALGLVGLGVAGIVAFLRWLRARPARTAGVPPASSTRRASISASRGIGVSRLIRQRKLGSD